MSRNDLELLLEQDITARENHESQTPKNYPWKRGEKKNNDDILENCVRTFHCKNII